MLTSSVLLAISVSLTAEAAGSSPPVDKSISRITGSPNYVAVTGINVPIASWNGFSGMMAVDAGLEIEDNKIRRQTELTMPRVRDTLRQSLHIFMNASYQAETVPDLEDMCARMQRAMDRLLGPGVAKVTISSAIIHPYS